MDNPRVSIIMTTRNRAAYIEKAIESALRQTFRDLELIIVDDMSTDGTSEIAKKWEMKDARVHYLPLRENLGIGAASNRGLIIAKGEYVAILDDDDEWCDVEKLEKQIKYLDEHPSCVACGSGMVAMNDKWEEKFRILRPSDDGDIRKKMLYSNQMINSSALFRMSVAEACGLYDEKIPQFADWDFWMKIGLKGRLYNFPEYMVKYRVWAKGSSFAKQRENAASAYIIVRRYRKEYPGFPLAVTLAVLYLAYSYFPARVRQCMNPLLSKAKKILTAR